MRILRFIHLIGVLAVAGCSWENDEAAVQARGLNELASDASKLLQEQVEADDNIRSAAFGVQVPSLGIEFDIAAGRSFFESETPMTADTGFMIASMTKTVVATRVLQLVEEGRLRLDDRLLDVGFLPPDVIEQLHRIDDESFGGRIRVRHLLNHTSGLRDYLLDDRNVISHEASSGVAAGSLAGIWLSHLPEFLQQREQGETRRPSEYGGELYSSKHWRHWDAEAFALDSRNRDAGLLNFFLAEMADSALFPPGESRHYSDTNYLLLGLMLESVTGSSLETQLDVGIFEKLRMADTYMSYASGTEPHELSVSDWYAFDIPMVSVGANTSWDWAGGGLVSTAKDLRTFLGSLMAGDLFEDPETLATMLEFVPLDVVDGSVSRGYGLGIGFTMTDLGPVWGHAGAWGSHMYHFPDHDLTIAGTVNDYGSVAKGREIAFAIAALVVEWRGQQLLPSTP